MGWGRGFSGRVILGGDRGVEYHVFRRVFTPTGRRPGDGGKPLLHGSSLYGTVGCRSKDGLRLFRELQGKSEVPKLYKTEYPIYQ